MLEFISNFTGRFFSNNSCDLNAMKAKLNNQCQNLRVERKKTKLYAL